MTRVKRLAIIGNACAGKTTLSRVLAQRENLPLTHVDSIQFTEGMNIRPHDESIAILSEIQSREEWLIDGYGPLDILEKRLEKAEKIIFIDFPIWRHYWWAIKRQVKSQWSPTRTELPQGCDDSTLPQTVRLLKSIWKVHTKMRPEMLRILAGKKFKSKVLFVRTLSDWRKL
jgi:adenylate kinase family enzyme